MKDLFLNNSINFIKKNTKYKDDDLELIKYGLEGIYLTLTKTIILIILAIIFNIVKELIFVIIFFNLIRFTAFGAHAEKSSICLITSLILMLGLTLLVFKISINPTIKLIICLLCIIDYILFAPADTVKRPLTNKKKRIIRKIISIITSTIYTVLIINLNNMFFSNTLFIALIIEAIMINPIMYKLFGVPFNNYKRIV